jgi:hypothetical protein
MTQLSGAVLDGGVAEFAGFRMVESARRLARIVLCEGA